MLQLRTLAELLPSAVPLPGKQLKPPTWSAPQHKHEATCKSVTKSMACCHAIPEGHKCHWYCFIHIESDSNWAHGMQMQLWHRYMPVEERARWNLSNASYIVGFVPHNSSESPRITLNAPSLHDFPCGKTFKFNTYMIYHDLPSGALLLWQWIMKPMPAEHRSHVYQATTNKQASHVCREKKLSPEQ